MTLRKWLETSGVLAIAKLAEDMPGGTHGKKKAEMIEWILSDEEATEYATSAMELNVRPASGPPVTGSVGFVNKQGDAL